MEVVAEDVDADALVHGVEHVDGALDALHRAGVGVHVPSAHALHDAAPDGGGIRYPLASVLVEHVVAHVVHHLDALHLGIDGQRLPHLLAHQAPSVAVHAAGSVDHEDDVLAVDGDAADGVVAAFEAEAQQPFHFVGKGLLGASEARQIALAPFGFLLARLLLRQHGVQFLFRLRQAGERLRQPPVLRGELARQGGGFAFDVAQRRALFVDGFLGILLRRGDGGGIHRLDDHQQQDDRPEAAAHHVQEGEPHFRHGPSLDHGQSSEGDM